MGGEIVARLAHCLGELGAGELHAVAGIPDEADHHAVQFLDMARRRKVVGRARGRPGIRLVGDARRCTHGLSSKSRLPAASAHAANYSFVSNHLVSSFIDLGQET